MLSQVSDRFHLLHNLRHAVEQQLSPAPRPGLQAGSSAPVDMAEPLGLIHRYGPPEVTEHRRLVQEGRGAGSQTEFDRVKFLQAEGESLAGIVRATSLHQRTVRKWTRLDAREPRATMAAKPTTPSGFGEHLARRWNEGCTMRSSCSRRCARSDTPAA
jgi:hypothetical protein